MKKSSMLLGLPLVLLTAPALAHTGGHVSGFMSGFIHPFTGIDHLIVMCLLGAWFATLRNGQMAKSAFTCTAVFAASIVVGSQLAAPQIALAEWVILVSAAAVALLVVARLKVGGLAPVLAACVICGHGITHGAEASGNLTSYTAGATLAMSVLVCSSVLLFSAALKLRALIKLA